MPVHSLVNSFLGTDPSTLNYVVGHGGPEPPGRRAARGVPGPCKDGAVPPEKDLTDAPGADDLLAMLDPEQRAVATALAGPVCVLAGAGTGKTRAITSRI